VFSNKQFELYYGHFALDLRYWKWWEKIISETTILFRLSSERVLFFLHGWKAVLCFNKAQNGYKRTQVHTTFELSMKGRPFQSTIIWDFR